MSGWTGIVGGGLMVHWLDTDDGLTLCGKFIGKGASTLATPPKKRAACPTCTRALEIIAEVTR